MKYVVKLSPDEVAVCHLIGRNRSLIARSSGVVDAKVGDQDGAEADVHGFMGEYAFAKNFNLFPDCGLVPRSGSADGTMKLGCRKVNYDIKATTYENGRLLCTTKNNPDVDIYVLTIITPPVVKIVGYAFKHELCKPENLVDLGHGQGYALDQDALRSFGSPLTLESLIARSASNDIQQS